MRWGIRAVIGESFAEIFFGNCLALGIPCATAEQQAIRSLQADVLEHPTREWVLDLETESLTSPALTRPVLIPPGPKQMLLSGRWDATSELLAAADAVDSLRSSLPYLNNFC